MPTEAVVEPVAPVATQPAEPVAPSTEAAPAASAKTIEQRSADLVSLLLTPTDDTPSTQPEKKPKVEAKPEPAATTPAKPEKVEKQIKVRKPTAPAAEERPPVPTRETAKQHTAQVTTQTAPHVEKSTAPVEDDSAFEKKLLEEEAALLADARDAERILGKKYDGFGKKTLEFFKASEKKEK